MVAMDGVIQVSMKKNMTRMSNGESFISDVNFCRGE